MVLSVAWGLTAGEYLETSVFLSVGGVGGMVNISVVGVLRSHGGEQKLFGKYVILLLH